MTARVEWNAERYHEVSRPHVDWGAAEIWREREGVALRAVGAAWLDEVRDALTGPNTDMAEAMVAMIESQRAFQLTSKAIQTQDQMWEIANGVKR